MRKNALKNILFFLTLQKTLNVKCSSDGHMSFVEVSVFKTIKFKYRTSCRNILFHELWLMLYLNCFVIATFEKHQVKLKVQSFSRSGLLRWNETRTREEIWCHHNTALASAMKPELSGFQDFVLSNIRRVPWFSSLSDLMKSGKTCLL